MPTDSPLDGVDLSHLASGDSRDDATQGSAPAGESSGAPTSEQQRSIPYDRFNEVVRERQLLQGRVAEMERKLAALAGISPPPAPPPEPEDPRIVEVRNDLFKVVPWLSRLERVAQMADRLPQVVETLPQIQQDTEAYWNGVAQQTMTRVFAESANALGTEKLSPRQQAMIHREFVEYVSSTPEIERRYNVQDPTLVADFVRSLSDDLLTPLRRRTEASVESRRERATRVPQGGTSSPPVGSAPPQRPKDEDALFSAAFQAFRDRIGGGS